MDIAFTPQQDDEIKAARPSLKGETTKRLSEFYRHSLAKRDKAVEYARTYLALRHAIERDLQTIRDLRANLDLKEARARMQADRLRGLMDVVEIYRSKENARERR